MPGYTDPFGGSSVQPAQVAYRAVALTANVVLSWPSVDGANYVARIMDVTPNAGGRTLTMPDARSVSPGYDVLFLNPSAFSYNVLANDGVTTICAVAPGAAQYVYVRTNTTAAGAWGVLQFASLASAVSAAALAGLGIDASGSTLQVSEPTQTLSVNTTFSASADLAKVYAWTGGVGTITLPTAAAAGSHYFVSVSNQGTGLLTLAAAGGDTIDGVSSISLQFGESCILHSGGIVAWYSVGRGRSTQFNFTLLSKAIASTTVTLTNVEAGNVVQKYTGVLTAATNVVVPSTVQVYYVSNQTTGAFTLTFKTAGVGTTVTVPTGQNAVLFCDGLNVINSSTTVSGISSLSLSPGSAGSPSLSFVGDPVSGLFQPASSTVGVAIAGAELARFNATGLSVSGTAQFNSGSIGAPGYSFNGDTDNGWWRPAADNQAWSVGGVKLMQLSSTGLFLSNGTFSAPTELLQLEKTTTIPRMSFLRTGVGSWLVGGPASAGNGFEISFNAQPATLSMPNSTSVQPGANNTIQLGDPAARWSAVNTVLLTVAGGASTQPVTVDGTNATGLFLRVTTSGTSRGYVGAGSALFVGGALSDFGIASEGALLFGGPAGAVSGRFDSSGNFGIGTSTVNAKFNVFKNSTYSSEASAGVYVQSGTGATNVGLLLGADKANNVAYIQSIEPATSYGSKSLALNPNGGAVGVGVLPSGTFLLEVAGKGSFANSVRIANDFQIEWGGTADSVVASAVTHRLDFYSNNVRQLRLENGTAAVLSSGLTVAGAVSGVTDLTTTGNSTLGNALGDTLTVAAGALKVLSDGRVAGDQLHNVGDVSGSANSFLASGTYTPTFTTGANVTAASGSGFWIRVGNVVHVCCTFSATTTASATASSVRISIPLNPTSGFISSGFGVGGDRNTTEAVSLVAAVSGSGNDLNVQWKAFGTGARSYVVEFTYFV